MLICIERGTNDCVWSSYCYFHLIISCFIKIQNGYDDHDDHDDDNEIINQDNDSGNMCPAAAFNSCLYCLCCRCYGCNDNCLVNAFSEMNTVSPVYVVGCGVSVLSVPCVR